MILLPMAFYAAGLSTERVVVAGDFRQLPPILQTQQQEIHDMLAPDIFEQAGITKAIRSKRHPAGLVMLVEQYRMHQLFGSIVSKVFYASTGGDALRSVQPRQSSAEPPALPEPFAQRVTIATRPESGRSRLATLQVAVQSYVTRSQRAILFFTSARLATSPKANPSASGRLTAHRRNLSAPSLRLMKSTRLFGHALLTAFRVTSAAPW